jgi:hypothetical protein
MGKFLLCLVCLTFLIAGCGESAEEKAMEEQIEKETGAEADVELTDETMKVTGETEGDKYSITSGEGAEIPEGFPTDVFIYSPAKASMAMEIPEGYSLALTTQDDLAKVRSAYGKEMEARGWAEEATMTMGSQTVLVYEKEERVANISIVPLGSESQISVTVTKE